jgi:hypothetical protein
MTQLRLSPTPLPDLPSRSAGTGAQVTHFLTLPDYLDPSDMEFLFQCREPRATWETLPREIVDGDIVEILPGTIRLSPRAIVHGPYSPRILAPESQSKVISLETGAVSMGDTGVILDTGVLHLDLGALDKDPETQPHPAQVPPQATLVWALTCVRERGEAPMRDVGDRDGLARIFAEGMPVREEFRQVTSLVSIARFLEGTAHFDAVLGGGAERYRSVAPDPAANVELTVYSDVWLDPQATLRLAQLVAPTMQYMPTEVEWDGPNLEAAQEVRDELVALAPDFLEKLHRTADEFDAQTLAEPEAVTAYGLVYEASKGDLVTVEVAGTQWLPPILENIEWAKNGVIEYRISWIPDDLEDWHRELPSFELRQRRTRITPLVRSLTRSLYSATAGEVVDQDGFLRDPASL